MELSDFLVAHQASLEVSFLDENDLFFAVGAGKVFEVFLVVYDAVQTYYI